MAVSGLRGERFGPIDLERAPKGEIVGIAGAEGNGQVQLLRALAGVERATGSACLRRRASSTCSSPLGPLRAGVVLLSGDRRGEALFPVLSVRANATVQVLRQLRALRVRRAASASGERVDELVGRLRVRMALDRAADAVALGRQPAEGLAHAAVPARRRQGDPRRRADAGRRRRRALRHLRGAAREGGRRGRDVVKSSDPIELAGLCDRVLVMSRGRIVEEIPGARAQRAADRRGDRRLGAAQRASSTAVPRMKRGWLPLVADGGADRRARRVRAVHARRRSSRKYNLNSLLLAAMPLALVAMGQTSALLVGGFDVSVGALMTMCVVTASFTITPGMSTARRSSRARSRSSASGSRRASSTRR